MGRGTVYREKNHLQGLSIERSKMCNRVRASTKGLKQFRGTVAFFKKRHRQRDYLQGDGPLAERVYLYRERRNMCKRVRVSTKGLKQCRGTLAFFKERHYLLQGEGVSTVRGTICRIRNNPYEQGVSARRVFTERRAIYRKRDYLEEEGLSTMRGNVHKKGVYLKGKRIAPTATTRSKFIKK